MTRVTHVTAEEVLAVIHAHGFGGDRARAAAEEIVRRAASEPTDLERRWNRAASLAGYAGSEFHNDPERVFARVRAGREKLMEVVRRKQRRLLEVER